MPRARGTGRRRDPPHVLVLTHSADADVPAQVASALAARGASCTRLDTDALPLRAVLSMSFGRAQHASWGGLDAELDLHRATAVWCRRLWTEPSAVLPADDAACAEAQLREHLFGTLAALPPRVTRVNDPHAQLRAEHKALQLSLAPRAGLDVPPTLITHDPAAAAAFLDAHEDVVTKLLAPVSQSFHGDRPMAWTQRVDAADRAALASLRHAPQIFQRAVPKQADARLVVVGDSLFAFDRPARPSEPVDWRAAPRRPWRTCRAPTAVRTGARRLARSLGLVTAALDFVVDAEGRWWFLEANPAGEWGFLAHDTGVPIAEAFARVLAP